METRAFQWCKWSTSASLLDGECDARDAEEYWVTGAYAASLLDGGYDARAVE